jgi:hypothetical protein
MYNRTPLNKRRLWSHVTWVLFPATCLASPSIRDVFVLCWESDWVEVLRRIPLRILEVRKSIPVARYCSSIVSRIHSHWANSYIDRFLTQAWFTLFFLKVEFIGEPITVAVRSKAWTVFARSNTGIVGSNPTQGMDVCVLLFCVRVVLCIGNDLATGWSPVQGVLPTVRPRSNKKTVDR